jgi:hypothetical protein
VSARTGALRMPQGAHIGAPLQGELLGFGSEGVSPSLQLYGRANGKHQNGLAFGKDRAVLSG